VLPRHDLDLTCLLQLGQNRSTSAAAIRDRPPAALSATQFGQQMASGA
jgi:hypothetical protein